MEGPKVPATSARGLQPFPTQPTRKQSPREQPAPKWPPTTGRTPQPDPPQPTPSPTRTTGAVAPPRSPRDTDKEKIPWSSQ